MGFLVHASLSLSFLVCVVAFGMGLDWKRKEQIFPRRFWYFSKPPTAEHILSSSNAFYLAQRIIQVLFFPGGDRELIEPDPRNAHFPHWKSFVEKRHKQIFPLPLHFLVLTDCQYVQLRSLLTMVGMGGGSPLCLFSCCFAVFLF